MTDIAIQDLEAYKHLLAPKIAFFYPNMLSFTIHEVIDDATQMCSCGCQNNPIGLIKIVLNSTPKVRKYGVLIFPTLTCIPAIANIDGRGYIIKVQMYDEICKWLKNIPRPLERHQQRTNTIKRELFEKTSPIFYDYIKL